MAELKMIPLMEAYLGQDGQKCPDCGEEMVYFLGSEEKLVYYCEVEGDFYREEGA